MSDKHEHGKILAENRLNIFEDCLHTYSDKGQFTLKKICAFICDYYIS